MSPQAVYLDAKFFQEVFYEKRWPPQGGSKLLGEGKKNKVQLEIKNKQKQRRQLVEGMSLGDALCSGSSTGRDPA